MCKCIQNMKFVSLGLRPGGLSIDNDNDANDGTQLTIHDCILFGINAK